MKKVSTLIKMALFENNELSLTRMLSVGSWSLFAGISIYMVLNGITWGHYETFALLTGGGGAATQVANKFVNGKYNSAPGSYAQAGDKGAR